MARKQYIQSLEEDCVISCGFPPRRSWKKITTTVIVFVVIIGLGVWSVLKGPVEGTTPEPPPTTGKIVTTVAYCTIVGIIIVLAFYYSSRHRHYKNLYEEQNRKLKEREINLDPQPPKRKGINPKYYINKD